MPRKIKRKSYWLIPTVWGAAIITIWVCWSVISTRILLHVPKDIMQKQQYSSTYLILNTLFSGAALIGVVYNVYKSGKDREEDQIENRFFKLFDLWLSNVENLIYTSQGARNLATNPLPIYVDNQGRKGLYKIHQAILNASISGKDFADCYDDFFHAAGEPILSPYFRLLYRTFKFIHESGFPKDRQKEYASIVRAVLSSKELAMLGANSLTYQGRKFSIYVVDYDLLKHLTNDVLWSSMDKDQLKQLIKAKSVEVLKEN